MREDWKTHLLDCGAEFVEDRLRDFGNAERERRAAVNGDVICDLSHRAQIRVQGADAATFLQGQFGNDIRAVSATHSQLSSYSSPKGRVYATFRVRLERENTYCLELAAPQAAFLRKRLAMFILRSRVTLEDAADCGVHFGVAGPHATLHLEHVLGKVPETTDAVLETHGLTVVRTRGMQSPRYEVFGTIEACRRLWDDLNVHCAPVGPEAWRLLDILAALPTIYPETSEAFVAQMLNLDALEAVSFTKGCYPGQEVVARMHYLGKLKRRMFRLAIEGQERPMPGSPVFRRDGDPAQPDGEIVDAALHPDGLWAALAVLQTSACGQPLAWGRPDGPAAVEISLPYPLPANG